MFKRSPQPSSQETLPPVLQQGEEDHSCLVAPSGSVKPPLFSRLIDYEGAAPNLFDENPKSREELREFKEFSDKRSSN